MKYWNLAKLFQRLIDKIAQQGRSPDGSGNVNSMLSARAHSVRKEKQQLIKAYQLLCDCDSGCW